MSDDEDIDEITLAPERAPPAKMSRDDFNKSFNADAFDPIADIKWVFHALGAEGLKPEDAPSPGAWSLLCSLLDDEIALKSFYTNTLPRVLPNRSTLDKDGERADDGREHFLLIERLLREPNEPAPVLNSTERRARELAVQGKGS